MSNPLHAAYYADQALHDRVALGEHRQVARDTYRARLECPAIARRVTPGQFVMLRLADCHDPLIGRALAVYDTYAATDGLPAGIDVVYLAKGKFTCRLAQCRPGQRLEIWGPLGNGFPAERIEHLIMVAGGIGQTPFVALAKEYLGGQRYGDPPRQVPPASRVTLCYGARSADMLAGVEDFSAAGVDVRLATEDGTRGHRGLVTDLLRQVLAESSLPRRIVCCGPEKMLEAVAGIAARTGTECQVSLETPMACGIGICFSCVCRVQDPTGGWDYKRTCVEGPVFDAARIAW
jgi:dihydroorotate dehydrogenase electron transfer subunit